MADRQTKDDFWDIEKLLPKKKSALSPFATHSPMAEYTDLVPPASKRADDAECRLSATVPSGNLTPSAETYVPAHQKLLRRVTVRRYEGRYMFYDSFRRAAELYYDVHGSPSPFVPFYSYMPQYQQMSREQKDYYFYWRDEVRAGRFIRTDVSYVYLYAYEIINLPEKQSPEQGLRQLLLLWKTYRKELRGIDKYFSVWIQDFCLIYRLIPPADLLDGCLAELISLTTFKEFYLFDTDAMTADGLRSLLFYFSDYDYHTSRYYTADSREAFEGHMCAVIGPLLSRVLATVDMAYAPTSLLVREAFPNSLCTYEVKCRLEIEYYPLARAAELRSAITAAVKYTENRLRASLGVKSRLAVRGLSEEHKAHIDVYFDTLFRKTLAEQRRRSTPEYEHKYDAPKEALSFIGADDIERISWKNTMRLVVDAESEDPTEHAPEERLDGVAPLAEQAATSPSADTVDGQRLSAAQIAFVAGILRDGDRPCGMEADVLAEAVNEAFLDILGDIILEQVNGAYSLIEDYREDVEAWALSKGM